MKYATASLGRSLVIRLEDGDVVHECIEEVLDRQGSPLPHALEQGADQSVVVGVDQDVARPPMGDHLYVAVALESEARVLGQPHAAGVDDERCDGTHLPAEGST